MWIKVMNNRDGDVGVLLLIMVVLLLLVVLMVAVVELGMVVMRTAMMVVKVVVMVVLVMLCRDVDGDVNDGIGSDGDNKGEVNCMVCWWR